MIRRKNLSDMAVQPGALETRPVVDVAPPSAPQARPPISDLATHPMPTVSVRELATHWGVCLETVYRDIRKGALPSYRTPGGTVRIRIEDARAYGRPAE